MGINSSLLGKLPSEVLVHTLEFWDTPNANYFRWRLTRVIRDPYQTFMELTSRGNFTMVCNMRRYFPSVPLEEGLFVSLENKFESLMTYFENLPVVLPPDVKKILGSKIDDPPYSDQFKRRLWVAIRHN